MCNYKCNECSQIKQVSRRHMCYDKPYRLSSIIFESEQRQFNGVRHYIKSYDSIIATNSHEKMSKIRFR